MRTPLTRWIAVVALVTGVGIATTALPAAADPPVPTGTSTTSTTTTSSTTTSSTTSVQAASTRVARPADWWL